MKTNWKIPSALAGVVLWALPGCAVQPQEANEANEAVGESKEAFSNPLYPDAFISMTSLVGAQGPNMGGQYYVPPGTAATATLKWKNPYFTAAYDFSGTVTCLQVSVDYAPQTLVDCENTGNNVYTTKASWITGGHSILFSLVNYNIPRGHAPSSAWQRQGLQTFLIDTHSTGI